MNNNDVYVYMDSIKFGPDFCGTSTRHVLFSVMVDGRLSLSPHHHSHRHIINSHHLFILSPLTCHPSNNLSITHIPIFSPLNYYYPTCIFFENLLGVEYDFTGKIRAISDRRTHSYTLIIYPDLTFKIGVDSPEYPYKTFNFKQHMSGILEKHPDYQVPVIGSVLLDVWQVRAGSMLDNLIISDEETEVSEWLEHRWNKNLFDQEWMVLKRTIEHEKQLNQLQQQELYTQHKLKQAEDSQKLLEMQEAQKQLKLEADMNRVAHEERVRREREEHNERIRVDLGNSATESDVITSTL